MNQTRQGGVEPGSGFWKRNHNGSLTGWEPRPYIRMESPHLQRFDRGDYDRIRREALREANLRGNGTPFGLSRPSPGSAEGGAEGVPQVGQGGG